MYAIGQPYNRLDNTLRSKLEDLLSGEFDAGGIRIGTALLSQVHTVRNSIDLSFDSLRKTFHQGEGTGEQNIDTECGESKTQAPAGAKTPAKHFRVRSELLCDY